MTETIHIPVMPKEVIQLAEIQPGQTWIDGTGGGGGHSRLLLEAVGETGKLLSIDRDPEAVQQLQVALGSVDSVASVRHASYDLLPGLIQQLGWTAVDGILLDLGLSSDQLADADRGFSFQSNGLLDMRFDPEDGLPAWRWLQQVDERTLADTIYQYGEERYSRRIAKRIVETRKITPIQTPEQLRTLIYSCVPAGRPSRHGRKHGRVDPATRTFQALRIAVNEELSILERALHLLPACLKPGGRLMIISFHSLEDRLVKHAFRNDDRLEIVTRKPVIASDFEIANNPRSRSAKLRVARARCPEMP